MLEHGVTFRHVPRGIASSPSIDRVVASCLKVAQGGTGAALSAAGIKRGELEEPARVH
jgi:hypothetical protein